MFAACIIMCMLLSACGMAGNVSPVGSGVADGAQTAGIMHDANENQNTDLYSAPKKTPEVYDAQNDDRKLEVISAAHSWGGGSVICGNCAVGALVQAEVDGTIYAVQSTGGVFALRVEKDAEELTAKVKQFYDGQQIGKTITWKGTLSTSDFLDERGWATLAGYENQLFYKKMLPEYQNASMLTDAEMEALKNKFAQRVEGLKAVGDGCEMIAVLVPSPTTVYAERIPVNFPEAGAVTKMDQTAQLLSDAGVTVLDLRNLFKAHKNDAMKLYYSYDSHWTEYGAYLAYVEICREMEKQYPAAAPRPFADFSWDGGYDTWLDYTSYLGLSDYARVDEYCYARNFKAKDVPEQVSSMQRYNSTESLVYPAYTDALTGDNRVVTGRPEFPDIYVMRNSYGASLVDILADRADTAMFRQMFLFDYNPDEIMANDPDYLIYVTTEWELYRILDN